MEDQYFAEAASFRHRFAFQHSIRKPQPGYVARQESLTTEHLPPFPSFLVTTLRITAIRISHSRAHTFTLTRK